jgi:hypothetical protein
MLGACATGKLFHADFNADTVGSPPATNPPGAPSGDKIWTPEVSQLMVVQSAELNSKAASYRNLVVPIGERHVWFMSATTTLPANQKFRAWWNGRIDLTYAGSGLDVSLEWGTLSTAIANFRFKDGQVRLRTSDVPSPTWETIGTYNESETHTAIITVDKAVAQYSLVIIPGAVSSGWRPVLSKALNTLAKPTLFFYYYEDGKYGVGKYVVDNISIEKVQ